MLMLLSLLSLLLCAQASDDGAEREPRSRPRGAGTADDEGIMTTATLMYGMP